MTDKLKQTIEIYDDNAKAFADYFRSINSARIEDIDIAFELLGDKPNPAVVEIGCADGRDAEEIVKRTTNYIGFDVSKKLIGLAKKNVPNGTFLVEDMRTFKFPAKLDIVFGFASLIHLNRQELTAAITDIYRSLNSGGILFISMKKGDNYQSYIKRDIHGERLFYLYSPKDIQELTKDCFKEVFSTSGFVTSINTQWFEVALRKI
jgi:SAM-dependent methyltransferase